MNFNECSNITINDKDVIKLKIDNKIVWEKEKPTTLYPIPEGDIYSGWRIGVVLVDVEGNPVSGKNIIVSGAANRTITTDEFGRILFPFSGTPNTTYTFMYTFEGDSFYESSSITSTVKVLPNLAVSKCTGTMSGNNNVVPYREWRDEYSDCDSNYAECTNIATASGSHKQPAVLTTSLSFSLPSNAVVTNLKAEWKSAVYPYSGGVNDYPSIGAPTVTISNDGSGTSHSKTAGTPGKGKYVSGSFNYSGATADGLKDGVNVKVAFPANTGGNMGKLRFIGVKLTATYYPVQSNL